MGRDPEQHGELRRTAELAFSVLGSLSETSVLVFDTDLRYVLAAGGALAAHGFVPDQLEGRLLSEVTQGATYERLAGNYRAALAGERRRFEHRSGDGTRIYEFDVAPVERDGEIVGGLAVFRDITERKRMERALAHSAREYRDLAEQASDVVARTDEEGVYTYVSPSSARVYGHAPEEMVGKSVFDFMHPDDHDAHRALRGALAAGADEEVAERRMKTLAGDWVWVEARYRALRDDDGRFVGVQSAARDISDRKMADEQFRTAFDDALVGIALVAPDGSWLRVNDSLCGIVGYSREQLHDMTFQDITHPEDLDADLAQLEETLAGRRAGYQMEKRYLRADGERGVGAAVGLARARRRRRAAALHLPDPGHLRAQAARGRAEPARHARRPHRPLQPPLLRARGRPVPAACCAATAGTPRCCSSTSTASRRSTTRSATSAATTCSSTSRTSSPAGCARAT